MKENTRFKIVVPSYNSYPWLETTLSSIANQEYSNYDVIVIDDASTDPRQKEVIESFCDKNGWIAQINSERQRALPNIIEGFKRLECQDEDVLMVIDGDDWLFNEYVFQQLNKVYTEKNILMTSGQAVRWRGQFIPRHRPPPWHIRLRRNYRKWWWFPFSHLRTWKYVLWRNIRDEDLRDPTTGEYATVTWDMAFMYPMAEMAGNRIHYEQRVQAVYNDQNPINDFRASLGNQVGLERHFRSLPKYPRLKIS